MNDLDKRLAGLSAEKRALLLKQLSRQAPAPQKNEIGKRIRPDRLPLSFAQQRLWILDRLDPGSAAYNVTSTMWLNGHLDIDVLQRSIGEIVNRHESLRTIIAEDDEGPYQVIQPPSDITIDMQQTSRFASEQRHEMAIEIARQEAKKPFNIASGPMLRSTLIQVDDEKHLLVINAHHIAIDGWSLGIVYDELAQLYAAFLENKPSPLPELPVQYVDYTLWQRELLEGEVLQKQLDYWQKCFESRPPVMELPTDRPRPAVQSHQGTVIRRVLPSALYESLKQLSRQEGVTPFMSLLAAFQILLLRYTGQPDLVVGVGVANRGRQELESLVGFFVNTLALRADLSGNPGFRELLAKIRGITLDAYSHQDLPVERLIEELKLERNLSHSPLFQTMLFFQNFPAQAIELPGLTLVPVDFDSIHAGTARADLTLFASEAEDGLGLFFEYATDLFDESTIDGFAQHLVRLIASIVANPSANIGELDILPPEERKQLLIDWNDTACDFGSANTVHELIEQQAARTPDAIALEYGDEKLSYRQLDDQATRLAKVLVEKGAKPGDMIGLFLDRSTRMLVAMLGILKTGAAYVPMDPGYPVERLNFMTEDSDIRLLVTERSLASESPTFNGQSVLVEDAISSDNGLQNDVLKNLANPEASAYVIFTSGTTGRPKGVQIPHRAVVNFIGSMAKTPGMTASDTICAVTTLSFDIAVLELLLPLTVGARIVIADRTTASDATSLAKLIETSRSTIMQATPATWRMLLESGWAGNSNLRILSGGEALSNELAERLLHCGRELWNLYGPTETTVWSALEQVQSGNAFISIGKPIANTQIYIVDSRQQLLPVGIPGELLIGGQGVASGYLGRPDLTDDKFIPDNFGLNKNARLYRTGDLARWHRDGRLEVLGRIDNQVKLRGFRIELGEIESVLAEHPSVGQAVVICREDRPGDKRLVAYVISATDVAPGNAELREFSRKRLPEYMVPSVCMILEKFPLTPNGKIDRRAFPAPEAGAVEEIAYVAPRNEDEETLTRLWAEVLGLPRVGIHDNFFDKGGHSLLATQLITRIQKAFGGHVALRTLFEASTVADFSEHMMKQRMESVGADALSNMLDQLEGLSDEDIEALLAGDNLSVQ